MLFTLMTMEENRALKEEIDKCKKIVYLLQILLVKQYSDIFFLLMML